jgi:hypothetical protein
MSEVVESTQSMGSTIAFTSHNSEQAFMLMRAEIEAVPAERTRPINSDLGFAVQTALWMSSSLDAIRTELEQAVPGYDLGIVQRFRASALALNFLHARYRILLRTTNSDSVQWLTKRRATFHVDAEVLAVRDLIDPAPLAELRHTNNHQLLAYDVMGLVDILLTNYHKFNGKCMTSQEELLQARDKANELFTELGTKQFGPKADGELKLLRRQGFALLNTLWAELDTFVRFARRNDGDAGRLVPSLYPKRGARKAAPEPDGAEDDPIDDEPTQDDELASAGELGPTEPLAFDLAAINRSVAAGVAAAPGEPAAPIRPGFPGAPPLRTKAEI